MPTGKNSKPLRVIVVSQVDLTRNELIRALAADVEGVPTFQAVMQLLDEFEQQVIDGLPGMVNSHGALASESGIIQGLRQFRDQLYDLRAQGKRGEDEPRHRI